MTPAWIARMTAGGVNSEYDRGGNSEYDRGGNSEYDRGGNISEYDRGAKTMACCIGYT